jgi:ubiquinone/menaquinone biosynthesis C-methylase UbiE
MKGLTKILSQTTRAWGSVGKSMIRLFKRASTIEKLLYISLFIMLIIIATKYDPDRVEGFKQSKELVVKTGPEIYDSFYVNRYDDLVFNKIKNDFELSSIAENTKATEKSVLLDVGSGTGHHVNAMQKRGWEVKGIDISPAMVKKAQANYPDASFQVGDAMKMMLYPGNSFTHITCLYFTIYYMKNKRQFFNNCMHWLMPGGTLSIHVVIKELFDPILPPGNPFTIVSPQKYADDRITSTEIIFKDYNYKSNFDIKPDSDVVIFHEKFKHRENGNVRKNELELHMPSHKKIINMAKKAGFIVLGQVDMVRCQYENQYLYILQKPN